MVRLLGLSTEAGKGSVKAMQGSRGAEEGTSGMEHGEKSKGEKKEGMGLDSSNSE